MQHATIADTRPDVYGPFLAAHRAHFDATAGKGPLFTTDAKGRLWGPFLRALPAEERQQHTCHACQHFVERYGDLVVITPEGRTVPVMWGEAPSFYGPAFAAVRRLVARADVTGVHVSSERVWGQPVTGVWQHMAVTPPPALVYRASRLKTASQRAAELHEDYGTLQRGLAEFPAEAILQAKTLLTNGALYRSEKCVEVATWLYELHQRRAAVTGSTARGNVTWLAVASALPGFCHVRSTMIGTLLEDLAAGLPFEAIRRKFNDKMDPLQYQRPQAAPAAGNIAQAEKVVAELGAAGALRRRFARLADLQTLWTPQPEAPTAPAGGVFGHLEPKGATPAAPSVQMPAVTMTWEKFQRTVLPEARRVEFLVPGERFVPRRLPFLAFVTAADPAAPPIVQWDREDRRCPVTWYLYSGGSSPADWGLAPGPVDVTAVALLPFMWDPEREYPHQGAGVVFVLKGARDLRYQRGASFFPEMLRAEYREIRATMEAYAQQAIIEGKDEAEACGIDLRKGAAWGYQFRVTTQDGVCVTYTLDRWD